MGKDGDGHQPRAMHILIGVFSCRPQPETDSLFQPGRRVQSSEPTLESNRAANPCRLFVFCRGNRIRTHRDMKHRQGMLVLNQNRYSVLKTRRVDYFGLLALRDQ